MNSYEFRLPVFRFFRKVFLIQIRLDELHRLQDIAVGASNGRSKKSQDDNYHQGNQRQQQSIFNQPLSEKGFYKKSFHRKPAINKCLKKTNRKITLLYHNSNQKNHSFQDCRRYNHFHAEKTAFQTFLENQEIDRNDPRRVGSPVRRLRPLLPAQIARRRHRRAFLHARGVPPVRHANLPLHAI